MRPRKGEVSDFERFLLEVKNCSPGGSFIWPKITPTHRCALRVARAWLSATFRIKEIAEGFRIYRVE